MKRLLKYALFLPLCLPVTHRGIAQGSFLQATSVRLPGEFPSAGIREVTQDSAGLIWYFTNNGLYRYDGNEVIKFDLDSKPSLPHIPIGYMVADGHGHLWMGYSHSALKFDLKKWKIIPIPFSAKSSLPIDEQRISTIACFNNKTYYGTASGNIFVVHRDSLQLIARTSNYVQIISEPMPGVLWITSGTGDMFRINFHDGQYQPPKHYKISQLVGSVGEVKFYKNSGQFLLRTDANMLLLGNIDQIKNTASKASSKTDAFYSHLKRIMLPKNVTEFRLFFIGYNHPAIISMKGKTKNNIYRLNLKTCLWQNLTLNKKMKFPGFIGAGGSYSSSTSLISGTQNLTRLKLTKNTFASIRKTFEQKNSIRCLFKKGHTLYYGSRIDGFAKYNLQTKKFHSILKDIKGIYDILPWGKDSLLLTQEGAPMLYWYNMTTNKITPIAIPGLSNNRNLGRNTVVHRVSKKLILLGNYQGVFLIAPKQQKHYPIFKGKGSQLLSNLKVNAIIPFSKPHPHHLGKYLIGSTGGVFIVNLDNGQVHRWIANADPIKEKNINTYSLLKIHHQIWSGTAGLGIVATNNRGHLLNMDRLNSQLTGNMVFSLTKYKHFILIGTNNGLNVFNLKDSTLKFYTEKDGLPSNEFNSNAVFKTKSGVYLGTVNGIVKWPPSAINKGHAPSKEKLQVNRFTITQKDGQVINYYNIPYLIDSNLAITIPSKAQQFSLSFGRSDEQGENINYFYRLKENEKWIALGHKRRIVFSHTPPGDYELQLARQIKNQAIIPYNSSLTITIKPTFFQTIYFKLILVLIIILIFYLAFRYREINKNKERNIRLNIAQDLHDEVGSSLTRIFYLSETEIAKLSAEQKDKTPNNGLMAIKRIEEISRDAVALMSDMVWSIDARFDTVEALTLRMKDYVYKLREELDIPIDFKISKDNQQAKIKQSVRQNLYLLFKEGVINALKYGDRDHLEINLNLTNKTSTLQIINSLPKKQRATNCHRQGGNGFENMRMRVRKIKGILKKEKSNGKFILTIRF